MFSRKELKERAKSVLKTNYWLALALTALIYIAEMAIVMVAYMLTFPTTIYLLAMSRVSEAVANFVPLFTSGIVTVASLFLMPLNVGFFRFLVKSSNSKTGDIKDIIWGYKNNFSNTLYTYIKIFFILMAFALIPVALVLVVATLSFMLYKILPTGFLYSDFFPILMSIIPITTLIVGMIPAMIKSYDYYLAYFILADEPELTSKEVLKRSKAIMKGNRFDTFILDLSFLGWELLGLICCCGIGTLFVTPYIYQTQAELYLELSGKKQNSTVSDVKFEETKETETEQASAPETEKNTEEENF